MWKELEPNKDHYKFSLHLEENLVSLFKANDLHYNGERAKIAMKWIDYNRYYFTFLLIARLFQLGFYCVNFFHLKALERTVDHLEWTFDYLILMAWIIQGYTIFYFISWFRRAYYNLSLRVSRVRFREYWCVIGWLIPVVNFVLPFIIMRELYTKWEAYFFRNDSAYRGYADPFRVNIWQKYFIISFLCITIPTIGLMIYDFYFEWLLTILSSIIALILGIRTAKRTNEVIDEFSKMEADVYDAELKQMKAMKRKYQFDV